MRDYPIDKTRNIGIVAHIDAGKTTTTERILYYTGVNHQIGEVHEGAATMDWMVQEQERGITITSAATNCFWKDLPHQYHRHAWTRGLHHRSRAARCACWMARSPSLLDGGNGVEPQTETVWRQADKYAVPRICFVNKMDKVGAEMEMNITSLKERLHVVPAPIQWPIGAEENFRGVVDLVRMLALEYDDTLGQKVTEKEIPADMRELVNGKRAELLDVVAEFDEEAMNLYLDSKPLPEAVLKRAIRKGTIAFKIVPILCGSSYKNKGVQQLLDAVIDYLPAPGDLPPKQGTNPAHGDKVETRQASDTEPLSAVAFKIMTDAFVGQLTFYSCLFRHPRKRGLRCGIR